MTAARPPDAPRPADAGDANLAGGVAGSHPAADDPGVNSDLLDQFRSSSIPVWRIYEPTELCAVLGAGGRPEQDLLLDTMKADGVPWRRRRGGGGTVVLGPGQVVLALVTEVSSPFRNKEYAGQINSWVVEAVESLGVHGAGPEGISDLAIRGKKIVGTSIYRTRLVLFYQASLLVSNDISVFTRYLSMPTKVPEYRAGRSHEDFCTTLAREGYRGTVADVMASLEKVIRARLPLLK
jgi:lipoate-protein ligase A